MTLLTICKGLALNVGLTVPDVVVSSPAREWAEALQMANETGDELARRADWGILQVSSDVVGTGSPGPIMIADDVSHLNEGITVWGPGIIRSLTRSEWNAVVGVQGTPRYFILEGADIRFWPYLALGATVQVRYKSKNWCSAGSAFVSDVNTSKIDEGLFLKGLIVRWRRQKGMDYADQEAEYEAALKEMSDFDERSRL